MTISRKVREAMAAQSWIRRMFEEGEELRRRYGPDAVCDFSLGNPNADPPPSFVEAVQAVAREAGGDRHRYMPNAGYPEVREVVAAHLARRMGQPLTENHVVMTVGAAGALNCVLKAVCDPGDEVILLAPYFAEYHFYVDNHQAVAKVVQTDASFDIDAAAVEAAITPQTKAVIINSPNNPSGRVYGRASLERLAAVLTEASRRNDRRIYLISDEPYRHLVYDGVEVPEVFPLYEDSVVATSHSKDLSIAGERIGYLVLNPACAAAADIFSAVTFVNRTLGFVNAPAMMQRVIAKVLGAEGVPVDRYRRKRDRLYEILVRLGFQVVKPEGAFYLFPASPIPDDVAFIRDLAKERVLVVPGSGFARPGHFRVSYAVSDDVISRAIPGLERVAERYGMVGSGLISRNQMEGEGT